MEWHETPKADLQKNLACRNRAMRYPSSQVKAPLPWKSISTDIPNAPLISEYIYI